MPRPRFSYSDDPAPVPPRPCDHPGCGGSGEFRAPRSRATLDDFYWFCLDHVREYNASWNYYAGMSSAEVEAQIRHDTVWQRPTWPLGARIGTLRGAKWRGFGLFDLTPPLTLAGLKMRYKELVKRHHPDVHGGDKEAEEKLKEINLAYSTLKASYFPS